MKTDKVVLVDTQDKPLQEIDKMEAHRKGLLHRAFSIFIFNAKGEMLIHQRAAKKYHGAGLWTNACCSHPQWDKDVESEALKRLDFEMGLHCSITKIFSFIYNSPVENGLIEHEFDHVFIGYTDSRPIPNPDEVQNYQWMHPEELIKEILQQPENFTVWFRTALNKVLIESVKKSL